MLLGWFLVLQGGTGLILGWYLVVLSGPEVVLDGLAVVLDGAGRAWDGSRRFWVHSGMVLRNLRLSWVVMVLSDSWWSWSVSAWYCNVLRWARMVQR